MFRIMKFTQYQEQKPEHVQLKILQAFDENKFTISKKNKVGDRSRSRLEGSLFDSYYTKVEQPNYKQTCVGDARRFWSGLFM